METLYLTKPYYGKPIKKLTRISSERYTATNKQIFNDQSETGTYLSTARKLNSDSVLQQMIQTIENCNKTLPLAQSRARELH